MMVFEGGATAKIGIRSNTSLHVSDQIMVLFDECSVLVICIFHCVICMIVLI